MITNRQYSWFAFAFGIVPALQASAGEVDAIAHMNRLMEAKPPVTYLREDVRWETIRFPGGTIRIPIPIKVPYQGPARAANSYVAEVTAFAFDKAKLVALPEISLYTHKQLLNCADTNVSSTVSLALTGAKGWSVSKTDGVSTTVSASASGSVGVPGVGSTHHHSSTRKIKPTSHFRTSTLLREIVLTSLVPINARRFRISSKK